MMEKKPYFILSKHFYIICCALYVFSELMNHCVKLRVFGTKLRKTGVIQEPWLRVSLINNMWPVTCYYHIIFIGDTLSELSYVKSTADTSEVLLLIDTLRLEVCHFVGWWHRSNVDIFH